MGAASWVWGGATDPTSWYDSATSSARTKRFQLTGTLSYATNRVIADQVSIEHKFDKGILSTIEVGVALSTTATRAAATAPRPRVSSCRT
jgi:hypothetical protein